MDEKFISMMKELEEFGKNNDAAVTDHSRKMLNIHRETGQFLALLLRAVKARRVLEIGTSNGYSTLWLAYGLQPLSGRVITVDVSELKMSWARANFERAGNLSSLIESHQVEAGDFIRRQPPNSFDFIFLDTVRTEYIDWWPVIQAVLAPGGLIVADNAVSHAGELEGFFHLVEATPGYLTSVVPVGKGELLIWKPL